MMTSYMPPMVENPACTWISRQLSLPPSLQHRAPATAVENPDRPAPSCRHQLCSGQAGSSGAPLIRLRPRIHEQKNSKVSNRQIRYAKQTEILTHATRVNGWEPAVYMSYMSQNFPLFRVSNLSVRNFRIISAHVSGVSAS